MSLWHYHAVMLQNLFYLHIESGIYVAMLKRTLDIIISLTLLIALLPVMLMVAILIRWKIGGKVLFRQQRPGLNGKPFTIIKFCTMEDSRGADGEPLPDDQRLTTFGNILRKASIDELPALWNVIKGDMSLVGPRPLLMEYLPLYNAEQMRRHDVLPGITGWAQVNGRNAISWPEKFKFDIWYVDNQSFLLDLKILLMTVKKVFWREGISQQGHVTMEKFTGNKE